jgi:hypothetical protein
MPLGQIAQDSGGDLAVPAEEKGGPKYRLGRTFRIDV